jgi:hypothetical protein
MLPLKERYQQHGGNFLVEILISTLIIFHFFMSYYFIVPCVMPAIKIVSRLAIKMINDYPTVCVYSATEPTGI